MVSKSAITFGRAAPGIFARELERSLAFYVNVLGFQKTFENGDPVGFVILKRDAAELHLNLVKDHKAATANVASILVENIGTLYQTCINSGVRIIKSLSDKDYGLRSFVFADPDGN